MSEKIPFSKMQGIGNDYIYINCLERNLLDPSGLAKRLSNRHFGIGADGLVLILPSATADFRMAMFNSDGSESEMCGNTVRCIAKFLYDKRITDAKSIKLETKAGIVVLELRVEGDRVRTVRVDLGEPILYGPEIPVLIDKPKVVSEPFPDGGEFGASAMTCVSMGNPHAVFFVDEPTDSLVLGLGPKVETHRLFPRRTNVEFATVIDRGHLKMRVWERGAGETLACGTGAAAVCVAAVLNGLAERRQQITLLGGELELEWGADNHVYKTGPAEFTFEGEFEL